MFKKILKGVMKTVLGIFVFYLVLGFVIVPLAAFWVVPWQGSRVLKTPVRVRSVFLNPLLLRVTVNGFEVLDHQQQLVFGFDRLFADASFRQLFKRIYRLETVRLEGVKVNAVLLPDGSLNLLNLVAQEPAREGSDSSEILESSERLGSLDAGEGLSEAKPLPLVMVDMFSLEDGEIRFEDRGMQPAFSTVLHKMALKVTGFSTLPDAQARISFQAELDQKGAVSIDALMSPMAHPLELEAGLNVNSYALEAVGPYVGKYTGRDLQDGILDLKMDYRVRDNQLKAGHRLLIQRFEFGRKVESPDALPLLFGLAVALLQDPQGKITISLPVTGDMTDPEFEYLHVIGQVARNFFLKIVTSPFSALASIVGGGQAGTDELGYVRFLPGRANLEEEEKEKLAVLAAGLKERPKLRLGINGSFDPEADWKAIQAESFARDYEALRRNSSRSDTEIYQTLYQRRFGIRALWNVSREYKSGVGRYDEVSLNQDIKRQLIENAPPDREALAALAMARAQAVYDVLLAGGCDAGRLSIGQARSVQSSMGRVTMEFTLTVFD